MFILHDSTVAALRGGIVTTSSTRSEFTIILIGESGVGKTSFLTLFYNILCGHQPEQYTSYCEQSNEVGGSQAHSQTQTATTYEFVSKNGFKIRIIDTPGLADTRGLAHDLFHKQSIAMTVQNNFNAVDAVLVLVNGTNPRLGVATDYALTTLASILPYNLLNNIGILFTNVSTPLSWNFETETLPDGFRDAEQFLIDNPIALLKKFEQLRSSSPTHKLIGALWRSVEECHTKALDVLAEILDWVGLRQSQPTDDMLILYTLFCDLNHHIADSIALADDMKAEEQLLAVMQAEAERAQVVSLLNQFLSTS